MFFSKNKNTKIAYFAVVFALSILLFGCNTAYAASLNFGPSSGNLTVGDIVNVSVSVNANGQAINNADATINFPASLLEVISISKSRSIFTLWVEEPVFSNATGRITFNGGLPAPGFNGSSGSIINIAFRLKSSGTASVFFSAGSVRANDGFGTDVLSSMGTATFTISPAPAPAPVPVAPVTVPEPVVAPVLDETVVEEAHVPTAPVELVVEEGRGNWFVEFISNINLHSSFLWLIIFIVILSILLMYGRSRFISLRTGVRRETDDVEKILHYSFDTLKEDIVACVGLLERARGRRRLTEEERAVVSLLKQHLRQTEQLVTKEIHDIRRNIEK